MTDKMTTRNTGLFRDGLASPSPHAGLALRVQDLLNAGEPTEKLLAELELFRSVCTDFEEDVVLEVMDRLVGWCSPSAVLKPTTELRPVLASMPIQAS